MVNSNKNTILNFIDKALSSIYFIPVMLIFGFICWEFKWTELVVLTYAFSLILILIFCKDVKNIFVPLFFVAFFIPDLEVMTNFLTYYIAIGAVVFTLVAFFIYKVIRDGVKILKGGKFTIGLLFSFVAFLLAGIIGQFIFVKMLTILMFVVAIYIFYVIAVHYTTNLKEYFEILLLIGGFIVGVQIMQNFLSGQNNAFFSSVCINTVVLYTTMAVIASFTLALRSKKDYLYYLLIILLNLFVAMSFCRMAMLLTVIIDVVFTILLLEKSKNAKMIIIMIILAFVIIAVTIFLFEPIKAFWVRVFTVKEGLNGRNKIWAFCFERFAEHPIFGYGFYYFDEVGGIAGSKGETGLILAHNTFIQWLTCTGIVGCLLLAIFYINKYKILCKNITIEKLFIFTSVIMVEASGLLDQSATSDPFLPILIILMIASIEGENKSPSLLENKE